MGRDRASRVTSAPRGLGLYRRSGREGFFFVKNLAARAKRYPAGTISPTYIDEQIRRSDGVLITSQKEAEAYCHRRSAQLNEMFLALDGEHIAYSGQDLEGIAQQLADQWIKAKQRGINLQQLDLGLWSAAEGHPPWADIYEKAAKERWAVAESNIKAGHIEVLKDGVAYDSSPLPQAWPIDLFLKHPPRKTVEKKRIAASALEQIRILQFTYLVVPHNPEESTEPTYFLPLDALKGEERKLERLCWDQGFRPNPEGLQAIRGRFRGLVQNHIETAEKVRDTGTLIPPKPSLPIKGATWERLLQAKISEGQARGTTTGITKALSRLQQWLSSSFSIQLPTALDGELALAYRDWILREAGLANTSASKELRYLNATFNAAVKQGLLDGNPFNNLPRDRRATMQQKLDSRKTFDSNKLISIKEAQQIYERMEKNNQGLRDPGFDIFYLQAVTGTRIQEVAGLRRCDFTQRNFEGKTYNCIEIRRWKGRGFGVMGERGGLKTPQSERIIPLPAAALDIWAKHAKQGDESPAFPNEQPKTAGANWGDNLARRLRAKIPGFKGTHAWRETMINNLLNSAVPQRIVEMVTGKTGMSPLNSYTSDDLPSMQKAIELHASALGLPKYR
jgi:integrase